MPNQPLAVHLKTERCTLRPALVSDLQSLVHAISHPSFPVGLPLADIYRKGELASWLDRTCQMNSTPHSAVWAIDLVSGEPSVGQLAVVARAEDHVLSFWLSPHFWGRGIARTAVSTALEHAFASGAAKRIWAATAVWNEPSAKLMLALGFSEDAILETGYTANGVNHAVRQFHILSNCRDNRVTTGG